MNLNNVVLLNIQKKTKRIQAHVCWSNEMIVQCIRHGYKLFDIDGSTRGNCSHKTTYPLIVAIQINTKMFSSKYK